MLVTVSSVRGSPGVTSWALLLAAAWPREAADVRVVLEADCSGGVLGARYQLGVEPGAVSLMSACRRRDTAVNPADHGRLLDEGLWVIPGPEVAEQAVPAWRSGVADVAAALASDDRLWVVDLGRSEPGSPARLLVEQAAVNVVITKGGIEDVVQVPARVAALEEVAPTVVMVVGSIGFPKNDLYRFLGGRKLWVVPSHNDLPRLTMRAVQGGRVRRSPMWRAAIQVAADLALFPSDGSAANMTPTAQPAQQAEPPIPPPDRRLDRLPDVGGGPESNAGQALPDNEASVALRAAVANSHLIGEADGG